METEVTSTKGILFHAALVLCASLKQCSGIKVNPLNPSDLSIDNCSKLVPDDLYTFLHWVHSTKPASSLDEINKALVECKTQSS